MLESLFNQVVGLQVFNFIKKRFQHRCFSANIAKFFKRPNLKKICERLLLNNVKSIFSFVYLKNSSCKCFSTFAGKHLCHSVLFKKCTGFIFIYLTLSLFKKMYRHWCFPHVYLKFLATTFLKSILL